MRILRASVRHEGTSRIGAGADGKPGRRPRRQGGPPRGSPRPRGRRHRVRHRRRRGSLRQGRPGRPTRVVRGALRVTGNSYPAAGVSLATAGSVVDRLREQVRLASGLSADNRLDDAAQQRAIACLERFGQRLRDMPPGSVRAVGTNTLRKARNSDAFLEAAALLERLAGLGDIADVLVPHDDGPRERRPAPRPPAPPPPPARGGPTAPPPPPPAATARPPSRGRCSSSPLPPVRLNGIAPIGSNEARTRTAPDLRLSDCPQ